MSESTVEFEIDRPPLPTTDGIIDLDYILGLYRKWAHDLSHVRRYQSLLHDARYDIRLGTDLLDSMLRLCRATMVPATFRVFTGAQFDDIESEILYMLIREATPELVTEISPCGGWSTSWILNALRDNGAGIVRSFDVDDQSLAKLPLSLRVGTHEFYKGDVVESKNIPDRIEHLFLDSDHSTEFGHWAIDNLFSRVESGAFVSVHDIYHPKGPTFSGGEAVVVLDWLERCQIPFFTAGRYHVPEVYEQVQQVRVQLGLDLPICESTTNSGIFFRMP